MLADLRALYISNWDVDTYTVRFNKVVLYLSATPSNE